MSAPEVGDWVRVIAGQWKGWEGVVTDAFEDFVAVDLGPDQFGTVYPRSIPAEYVEKVPQTRQNRPQSDDGAEDVGLDVPGADGARRGAER